MTKRNKKSKNSKFKLIIILLVFLLVIGIFLGLNVFNYIMKNNEILEKVNSMDDSNIIEYESNSDTLRLSQKVISTLQSNNITLKIKNKDNIITILPENLSKKINLEIIVNKGIIYEVSEEESLYFNGEKNYIYTLKLDTNWQYLDVYASDINSSISKIHSNVKCEEGIITFEGVNLEVNQYILTKSIETGVTIEGEKDSLINMSVGSQRKILYNN